MTEESIMEFPCDFPIKIMGEDNPEFRQTVRALVEKHTGPLSDSAIQAAFDPEVDILHRRLKPQASELQQATEPTIIAGGSLALEE